MLPSRDVSGFLVKPLDLAEQVKLTRDILLRNKDPRKRKMLAVDDQEASRRLRPSSRFSR